jgi:hypothetical protein
MSPRVWSPISLNQRAVGAEKAADNLQRMRYLIMVSSPGAEAKTYEIEAESMQIAAAKANGRFMRENPTISQFKLSVVVYDGAVARTI